MTAAPPTRLICPLTGTTLSAMAEQARLARQQGADTLECRLDFLQTLPVPSELINWLDALPLATVATCRPSREGGHFDGNEADRLGLLAAAGQASRVVAVDVEMDVPPDRWPVDPSRVILSHHDFIAMPENLDELVRRLEASPAAINKLAFAASNPADAVRALGIVRACTKPTLALAMGEAGLPSRILAGKVGAWGTFAALSDDESSAPGQPTLDAMHRLYRWPTIRRTTGVFGVIGCPVAHSMSPAIHNAAFEVAGVDGVYLPLRIEPSADEFNRFMDAVLAADWLDLRGLSVTLPHKEHALAYVGPDRCDALAVRIGAINTLTVEEDGLAGDNTDYAAAIDALCDAMRIERDDLAGRTVAVLGAGGAARAIVAALAHYRAEVVLYNRTLSRAQALAGEFHCRAEPLEQASATTASILINCTPLGMSPDIDRSPLETIPSSVEVVFDTIYNPLQTRLLQQADRAGCVTVTGLAMFVNQALAQFQRWLDTPAPRDVMCQVVRARLT